jgi:hypothetical protein
MEPSTLDYCRRTALNRPVLPDAGRHFQETRAMKNADPKAPQGPGIQPPSASQNLVASLEHMPDAEIASVIKKAQAILAAREDERRKAAEQKKQEERDAAMREIQDLAKKHGLKLKATAKKGKRGRPRKHKGPAPA